MAEIKLNLTNCTGSLEPNTSSIQMGETKEVSIKANPYCYFNSLNDLNIVGGYIIESNFTDVNINATFELPNDEIQEVVITAIAATPDPKLISYSLTNCRKITAPDNIPYENWNDETYISFEADSGYHFNSTAFNIINANVIDLNISNTSITAKIVDVEPETDGVYITVTALEDVPTPPQPESNLVYSLINCTGSSNNPTTMSANDEVTVQFTANDGFYFNNNSLQVIYADNFDTTQTENSLSTVIGSPKQENVLIGVEAFSKIIPVTYNLENCTGNSNNITQILYTQLNNEFLLEFTANTGYEFTGTPFTVWGAEYIDANVSESNTKLAFKITDFSTFDSAVIVSVKTVKIDNTVPISYNLLNCIGVNNPDKIEINDEVLVTFTANAGYYFNYNSLFMSNVNYYDLELTDAKMSFRIAEPVKPIAEITCQAIKIPVKKNISYNLLNCSGSLSNPSVIAVNDEVSLQFTALLGYKFNDNSLVIANADSFDIQINNNTIFCKIANPTDNVSITVTAIKNDFLINYNLDNCIGSINNANSIGTNEVIKLNFYPENGYYFNNNSINITGATHTQTLNVDYITVTISNPTQNVNISVSAFSNKYTIYYNLTNVLGASDNPSIIDKTLQSIQLNFSPENGYALPDSVLVTGADIVNWNKSNGILNLNNISDNIIISIYGLSALATKSTIELYQYSGESNIVNKNIVQIGTISGVFRDAVSVINLDVEIEYDRFPNFNYVYIPDLNRYYYVDNIVAVNKSLYVISLSVDVLMTYRKGIYNLTAFIDRNEFNYDELIPDDEIVVEDGADYDVITVENQVFANAGSNVQEFDENGIPIDGQYSPVFILNIANSKR